MSINPDINKLTNASKEDWVIGFARFGLISKGVVYCLLGILAAMAAFGLGGQSTDQKGVMSFILHQPFGKILLALVAIGLLGYMVWRLTQAIKDTENKGNDAKGVFKRLGYAGTGLTHAALAFYAGKLVINGGGGSENSGGGGNGQEKMASTVLEQPFGQYLLGIVALIFLGIALYQFYRAFSGKFKKRIEQSRLSERQREFFMTAGRAGYTSRGIVLSIIAYFMLRAAIEARSSEAKDTEEAFGFLRDSPWGMWLMGAVALGLVCYGIFMFVRARYERINGG